MKTVRIEGMSCQHCVAAVTEAMSSLGDVKMIEVSLEGKMAKVEYASEVSDEMIKEAIDDIGFDVVSID